ncbi:DUF1127 domain-containing protein [Jannaschia sp. LMIT008]|uniref:DUF1127 domain-containing protein n=1 Tax=Jannaschia maritima TaxID=3032585 RepID=UPI0028124D5E|nr:DUF1127 domain-containing protein [Jannaschia sp. LMIT008]
MAYTTYGNPVVRKNGLARYVDGIKTSYAQWRVYRKTRDELSALSERDLADLGVAPGDVEAIARQAAYGH